MRNIFLFIRRFSNLILFLILQGIGIYILYSYNKTQQAVIGGIANEVTGSISQRYNNIEYYFRLKQTNEQLAKQNAQLLNTLRSSFGGADTSTTIKIDSLLKDTLGIRQFRYLEAKVVNNSVSQENNYITLHRGALQGVTTNMAVIGPDGIVGKVIDTSANYCLVMSLLNRKSVVSAMTKRDFYTGDLKWNGGDPQYLTLTGISKSAQVKKGDTIVTSNISQALSFPPGLMIGTVAEVSADKASNFYTLKIKAATNFSTLQYVYLTENLLLDEEKKLESKTPKD